MRQPRLLKSNSCTEIAGVDLADISVKVKRALPGEVSGRAVKLALPKGCDDAAREVSRSHSSRAIDEGPNRLRNGSGSFQN